MLLNSEWRNNNLVKGNKFLIDTIEDEYEIEFNTKGTKYEGELK